MCDSSDSSDVGDFAPFQKDWTKIIHFQTLETSWIFNVSDLFIITNAWILPHPSPFTVTTFNYGWRFSHRRRQFHLTRAEARHRLQWWKRRKLWVLRGKRWQRFWKVRGVSCLFQLRHCPVKTILSVLSEMADLSPPPGDRGLVRRHSWLRTSLRRTAPNTDNLVPPRRWGSFR